MYGNGYSMAIVLDHRSTALTETKIGASAKAQPIWDFAKALLALLPRSQTQGGTWYCIPQLS